MEYCANKVVEIKRIIELHHPYLNTKLPFLSNTWIRLLPVSETTMCSEEGMKATPRGWFNIPSPDPCDPNLKINCPFELKT